jgi:hypothetical protein
LQAGLATPPIGNSSFDMSRFQLLQPGIRPSIPTCAAPPIGNSSFDVSRFQLLQPRIRPSTPTCARRCVCSTGRCNQLRDLGGGETPRRVCKMILGITRPADGLGALFLGCAGQRARPARFNSPRTLSFTPAFKLIQFVFRRRAVSDFNVNKP